MRVFYFKNSDQSDILRDNSGNVELDEAGKTKDGDYYKIEVKVPKKDCTIDFRGYAKWTPMQLNELHEQANEPRYSVPKAFISGLKMIASMILDIIKSCENVEKPDRKEDLLK